MVNYEDVVTNAEGGGSCPVQYEGKLKNGLGFYFRYRFGVAMLMLNNTRGASMETYPNGDADGDLTEEQYQWVFMELYAALYPTDDERIKTW